MRDEPASARFVWGSDPIVHCEGRGLGVDGGAVVRACQSVSAFPDPRFQEDDAVEAVAQLGREAQEAGGGGVGDEAERQRLC